MAYTSDSATDRLAAVRASIARVLNAQGYGLRGRNTQYAALSTLREMERELMREVDAGSSSMCSVAVQLAQR